MRLTVLKMVTDFTQPVCQLLSLQSNCSDNCSLSMWELSVQVTDGAGGTGIDRVRLTQGNGTLNASQAEGHDNVMLVSYNASCCSPDAELVVVDRVGNVGSCFYTVQKAAVNINQTAPVTTTTNTLQPQPVVSAGTKDVQSFLLRFSILIVGLSLPSKVGIN
ncbi:hypothetical protein Q8A73_022538 [Channa argus]|nr:hypothetical protein Q8A73_022538 [Channa argus]